MVLKGGLVLDAVAIGKRVRERREAAGFTQRETVEGTSITYAYMSRIESGQRLPSVPVVIELAMILHTDALWLLLGSPRPPECPLCGAAQPTHYDLED